MSNADFTADKVARQGLKAPIPRLPVLGWASFSSARRGQQPCLLDQTDVSLSTSGRASLLLAVELLRIKPGERVLVPTYHCPTMITPVTAVGAIPLFYPIDASGGAQIEWLAQQVHKDVRAIFAPHYFGLPQPMHELRAWCDKNGIALIEDCAHALFGTSGSRPIGQWGDISIGSLTKFLPVPEGGCLRVNANLGTIPSLKKPRFIEQVKAVLDIVHVAAAHRRLTGLNSLLLGAFYLRGILKRAPNSLSSASVDVSKEQTEESKDGFTLDTQLSHRALTWAPSWVARKAPRARIIERRRRHFNELGRLLSAIPGLRPLHSQVPEGAVPYVFPLWVEKPDPGYRQLRKAGVPISRWDWLWPDTPIIVGDSGTLWSHHILQLACHQDLSDADVQAIADTIVQVYAQAPCTSTHREAATA